MASAENMTETKAAEPGRVRPRDAASLILLDPVAGTVLMGRRARRHRFLPDLFVFPGGRVDAADRQVPVIRPYRPEIAEALARTGSGRLAQALGCAAVRETFEETGLLIGQTPHGCAAADLAPLEYVARAITPPTSPIRFHARFFLTERASTRGEPRSNGELIDLDWYPIEDALRLPVADITEFVLGELRRRLAGEPTLGPLRWSYRAGKRLIRRG